jgi:Putative polyhydroxyalkanoic acid system protein (PHA_gran_rgn)
MPKPLVVSIPHHLGKEEAVRRLKSGLGSVRTSYGHLFNVQEETWTGDRLQFRVSALGQAVGGTIDVADDRVDLEIVLPWLLAKLAEKIQPLIRREGTLLLDKK